ncbi:DUF6286 domain-containing protein [Rathayibacter sp. SD072]|uniref:DUF6286 domain-containing protein n=1 Tax=Rathayibacter sp. SD072 TaxID=2781731 RepID=UPI0027DA28DC|nr:DUF6286 domain-containing protein [Rathayibacter sp. SD072]
MTTPAQPATDALYRRVLRRETHSSRSGSAIALAILLILLFAWLGTEAVLAVLGQPALLVAPQDGAAALLGAAGAPIALTAAGAVLAVIGLVLLVLSFAPGRRGRRSAGIDRTAVVVDDRVIAQSVARAAAYAGGIDPDQVQVSVGRRRVGVVVQRTSGVSTDAASIREAVDAELSGYDVSPALTGRVRLSEKGTVR